MILLIELEIFTWLSIFDRSSGINLDLILKSSDFIALCMQRITLKE